MGKILAVGAAVATILVVIFIYRNLMTENTTLKKTLDEMKTQGQSKTQTGTDWDKLKKENEMLGTRIQELNQQNIQLEGKKKEIEGKLEGTGKRNKDLTSRIKDLEEKLRRPIVKKEELEYRSVLSIFDGDLTIKPYDDDRILRCNDDERPFSVEFEDGKKSAKCMKQGSRWNFSHGGNAYAIKLIRYEGLRVTGVGMWRLDKLPETPGSTIRPTPENTRPIEIEIIKKLGKGE